MDEEVTEHTTLIAEAQGNIKNLIAGMQQKDREINSLQGQVASLWGLVDELLVWVTALEGRRDSLIEIPDSPIPIPVPLPAKHQLIPIKGMAPLEEVFRVLEGEDAYELGVEGEIFEDGETILDVLQRRNLRGDEVPLYEQPPDYNNLGYISNH